jgi:hypothetical protein
MNRLQEIDNQIKKLKAERQRIVEAEKPIHSNPKVDQFLKNYTGKRLLEKYSLEATRVWDIYGEDSNCDLGGSHSQPHLATVEGTLIKAVEYAVCLKNFYQWGAGGDIREAKQSTPIKL